MNKILHGDALEVLKTLEDESVDLVCTDPPYGIGFMGKEWDTFKPERVQKMAEQNKKRPPRTDGRNVPIGGPARDAGTYDYRKNKQFQEFITEHGKEWLRVLKPGAFVFMTMSPRQDVLSRAMLALEDAGFNTGFTSMYWTFASGFPKALSIAKNIGKMTDEVCDEIKSSWSANSATKDFQDRLVASETGTTFVAHYVEVSPKQLRFSVRAEVMSESREAFGFSQINITVPASALIEECERALNKIKGGALSKTELGNPKSYKSVNTNALCAELIDGWKHIISSKLETDPTFATNSPTECVSATTVTITESTMERLISSTADTLAKKLGGERVKVPSKRHGGGSSEIFEERGTTDDEVSNHQLAGSFAGFQPKPAVEVIIVAMKPLSEKTYVDQALKNGRGITWLDDCRVPTKETYSYPNGPGGKHANPMDWEKEAARTEPQSNDARGRFPANLLVSDDVLNDGRVLRARGNKKPEVRNSFAFGQECEYPHESGASDSGSYSRFFSLDSWAQTLPFLAVAKASKSEKNRGLAQLTPKPGSARQVASEWKVDVRHPEGGYTTAPQSKSGNHHPTVKPLKLMSYLITLGSRPGDTVLDPFLGSGTTAIAAKQLGRKYIGIEREQEYVEITEARLAAVQPTLLTQPTVEQMKEELTQPTVENKV